MEQEYFEEHIVKNRLFLTEKTLGSKADEYARGDRLSNFKKAAHLMNCTPEKALSSFVGKHIIALYDFIEDLEKGTMQSDERWAEKIQDIICYMILLEALLIERKQNFVTSVDSVAEKGEIKNEKK